jgi:hypothetical protein
LWEFVIVVGAFGAIYWFGWLRRMTRTPSSVPVEEKAAQQGGVQGADLTGSLPRHDD